MVKKYIVEMESGTHIFVLGPEGITHIGEPDVVYGTVDGMQIGDAVINAKPYTEPDLEQIRKEAYEQGYYIGCSKYPNKSYEDGLKDAWDAARKIVIGDISIITSVFGTASRSIIIRDLTAAKVIEKLRAYEQEQEEKKKTNYYFDMMKDAIETSAKEYGMSLDEVAAVLDKMRKPAAVQGAIAQ